MATNFPNNPNLNDVYTNGDRSWTWTGIYWKASSTTIGFTGSKGESSYITSDTNPLNPQVGDRWFNTTDGVELVWTDDGDTTQWVEVAASGFIGMTGYTGSSGAYAAVGYTGSTSTVPGYTGSIGYTGSRGAFGFTGSIGAGYTGSKGIPGDSGPQGYWGSVGPDGYIGSQGYTGSQGTIGRAIAAAIIFGG